MSVPETLRPRFGVSPQTAYIAGIVSWFSGMGLQFVIIPTLAAVYLNSTAQELAIAQMSISIPQLLLLFITGQIADRSNARRMLIGIHGLAIIPPFMTFWLVYSGNLTYWNIIVYGLCMGSLFAFSAPTRDALMQRVMTTDIQRGVMASMIAQFTAQLAGFVLAGIAAPLAGPWTLPAMHAMVLAFGLFAAALLPNLPPIDHGPEPERSWLSGVKVVMRSDLLRPTLILNFAVGIFFVGPFMVSFPLIVRDIFGGGQLEISVTSLAFWGGTIVTTVVMMRRSSIRRRGALMCFGVIVGSMGLIGACLAPSFVIMCACCTFWGLCAGFNMTMSRTIVQTAAPPRIRAQIMALYNMGFIGSAPIGAFAMGYLSPLIGQRLAPTLSGLAIILVTLFMVGTTNIARITDQDLEAA